MFYICFISSLRQCNTLYINTTPSLISLSQSNSLNKNTMPSLISSLRQYNTYTQIQHPVSSAHYTSLTFRIKMHHIPPNPQHNVNMSWRLRSTHTKILGKMQLDSRTGLVQTLYLHMHILSHDLSLFALKNVY